MRKLIRFLRIVIAICLLPLVYALLMDSIARLNSCIVHEGHPNPCVFLGMDWGQVIYDSFGAGLISVITVPIAVVLALIIWGLVAFDKGRKDREKEHD